MLPEQRADQIRRLSKKWLESGNDMILNELTHAMHDGVHFKSPSRLILERYLKLRLELDESDFLISGANERQCERSVFIDVHELVQNPEGMELGVRLPGTVRLQTLDDCFRLNGYATESILFEIPLESVIGQTDRKLVGRGRGFFVDQNQLPDNMIESRSQIVQTLPNDDAETKIGIRKTKGKTEAAIYVRVSLGENTAFFQTSLDSSLYRCEVFFCPDDFLPNSV